MLLDDTQPDEPKTLIEEKVKKVTTERAPVAGQSQRNNGIGRSGGRSRNPLESLAGGDRFSGNPLTDPLLRNRSPFSLLGAQTPGSLGAADIGSGAAAAAGVLTAVDEDGEGDEEAPVPKDFDYYTDSADDDEA